MKRIAILVPHYNDNKISYQLIKLANLLSNKYDVTISSLFELQINKDKLNSNIKLETFINSKKVLNNKFIYLLYKSKIINKINNYDAVIAMEDIYLKNLSKYNLKKTIKIGYISNDCDINLDKLDYIVTNSKQLYDNLNINDKLIYIPRHFDILDVYKSSLKNKTIISFIESYEFENYNDFLYAFAFISKKVTNLRLNIITENIDINRLQKKIDKLNLTDIVCIYQDESNFNVDKLLERASLFVMLSNYEKQYDLLIKSFSYNIPAISYGFINEIITDNWNGYVVKNGEKDKLIKRMYELITNYNRTYIMGKNAYKKTREYSLEKSLVEWEKIIG